MRFSRDQSELVRRFAQETGRALRSGQWHRKNQTPEWKEFVARRAGVAERLEREPVPVVGPAETQAQPAEGDPAAKDRPVKTREEEMELMAWVNWKATAALVQQALKARDINLAAFLKAEGEAQKRFREARRLREQAELTAGRLRPASDFAEIRRTIIAGLRNVIENMPMEAGPQCNPFDHAFAINALEQWKNSRFKPQYDAALAYLSRYDNIQEPQAEQ